MRKVQNSSQMLQLGEFQVNCCSMPKDCPNARFTRIRVKRSSSAKGRINERRASGGGYRPAAFDQDHREVYIDMQRPQATKTPDDKRAHTFQISKAIAVTMGDDKAAQNEKEINEKIGIADEIQRIDLH